MPANHTIVTNPEAFHSCHPFTGGPYGLRVTDGASTYDFVISADGERVVAFAGDTVLSEMEMRVMPDEIQKLVRSVSVTILGLRE